MHTVTNNAETSALIDYQDHLGKVLLVTRLHGRDRASDPVTLSLDPPVRARVVETDRADVLLSMSPELAPEWNVHLLDDLKKLPADQQTQLQALDCFHVSGFVYDEATGTRTDEEVGWRVDPDGSHWHSSHAIGFTRGEAAASAYRRSRDAVWEAESEVSDAIWVQIDLLRRMIARLHAMREYVLPSLDRSLYQRIPEEQIASLGNSTSFQKIAVVGLTFPKKGVPQPRKFDADTKEDVRYLCIDSEGELYELTFNPTATTPATLETAEPSLYDPDADLGRNGVFQALLAVAEHAAAALQAQREEVAQARAKVEHSKKILDSFRNT